MQVKKWQRKSREEKTCSENQKFQERVTHSRNGMNMAQAENGVRVEPNEICAGSSAANRPVPSMTWRRQEYMQ